MQLVSWNIQWGRGCDGRVDLARIVAHARRFADFDVLCLQEVSAGYPELPGSDGGDQFDALARLLPGYQAIEAVATDSPGPDGSRRRFGNLLLSRLPLGPVYRHLLPWPADPAVPSMQRVALEATVHAPGGPLRVITTHLEWYSPLQRAAQVERLRELQREGHAQAVTARLASQTPGPFDPVPRGVPAVVVGDFNFRPATPEHQRLQAPIDAATPGWRDAWELLHPGQPHPPSVGLYDQQQWPGPPFTMDFAFVSEDLAPKVRELRFDPSSDASDHQPLLLTLA